jgi:hypothetical protein
LPASSVLDKQGVLPGDAAAPRYVRHFHEQEMTGSAATDRRYAAIYDTLVVIALGGRQSQFVRIRQPVFETAIEHVTKFLVVAMEIQQRLVARAALADAEQVFCRCIEIADQEILINEDDCGVEAFDQVVAVT